MALSHYKANNGNRTACMLRVLWTTNWTSATSKVTCPDCRQSSVFKKMM